MRYIEKVKNVKDDDGIALVTFPPHFDDVVEIMSQEGRIPAKLSKWAKYLVDDEVDDETLSQGLPREKLREHTKLRKGLQKVRELDMILIQKSREARQAREAAKLLHQGLGEESDEDAELLGPARRRHHGVSSSVPRAPPLDAMDARNARPDARYFKLLPGEEARVLAILAEDEAMGEMEEAYGGGGGEGEVAMDHPDVPSGGPVNEYSLGPADTDRVAEIDALLLEMGHASPTDCCSRMAPAPGGSSPAGYGGGGDASLDPPSSGSARPTASSASGIHGMGLDPFNKKSRGETDWLREGRLRREETAAMRGVESELHRLRVQAWGPMSEYVDPALVAHLVSAAKGSFPPPSGADRSAVSSLLDEMRAKNAFSSVSSTPRGQGLGLGGVNDTQLSASEIHRRMRESMAAEEASRLCVSGGGGASLVLVEDLVSCIDLDDFPEDPEEGFTEPILDPVPPHANEAAPATSPRSPSASSSETRQGGHTSKRASAPPNPGTRAAHKPPLQIGSAPQTGLLARPSGGGRPGSQQGPRGPGRELILGELPNAAKVCTTLQPKLLARHTAANVRAQANVTSTAL